nr:hypothetical protein BaRGS_022044 [Batillaria attramentaria]
MNGATYEKENFFAPELLEQLDWNYVAIVYDEDDYGRSAATELRRLAEDRQICVPVFESMPIDTSSEAFNSRANHIAEEMKSTENGLVRGMVILGGRRTTRQLIRKLASQVNYVNLILSEAIGLQPTALQMAGGLQAALEASTLPVSNLAPMVSTFANVSDLAFDESGNVRQQRDIQYMVYNFRESQGNFVFKQDVLRDRSVGLVVINSCSSPLLVRQRLLDLHTGRLILPGGRNASSIVPNIMGYVGAYYSGNSIAAADTLTDIKYPFVQVILDVVTRLEANYVQIIYDSSTAYAAGLYKAIEEEINSCRYNVCIAQAIPVTPREDATQYTQILDKLRTKPSAKVVITILHPVEIEKTMDAIFLLRKSTDNFLFIGTDSWGRRYELIEGRSKLGGSLVLSQEVAVDKSFERYFAEVDPSLSENPWLKPFWEKRGECYFDKSFERAGKSGPCSEDFAVDYVQDFRAPFHINAVYALVLGFNGALSKYCGTQATGICDAMTSERLVAEMKKVQLDLYSTGRNIGVFDKNGDGCGRVQGAASPAFG